MVIRAVLPEGVHEYPHEDAALARVAELRALPPAEVLERDRAELGALLAGLQRVGVAAPEPSTATTRRRTGG